MLWLAAALSSKSRGCNRWMLCSSRWRSCATRRHEFKAAIMKRSCTMQGHRSGLVVQQTLCSAHLQQYSPHTHTHTAYGTKLILCTHCAYGTNLILCTHCAYGTNLILCTQCAYGTNLILPTHWVWNLPDTFHTWHIKLTWYFAHTVNMELKAGWH